MMRENPIDYRSLQKKENDFLKEVPNIVEFISL